MLHPRRVCVVIFALLSGHAVHGSFLSTLNDDDPSFVYTPASAWSQSIHPQDLHGESTVTTTVGASVSFTFTGSSFRYVGERWVDQSTSTVTVDGQLYTVDEFANATDIEFNVVLLDLDPIPFQRHNVTITKTGAAGKYTTLDYIQFRVDSAAPSKSTANTTSPSIPVPANTSPGTLVTIPDDHPGLQYSSGWNHCPHPEDQGGSSSCSTTSGASVNFSFAGTSISWIGEMYSDQGVSIVTLDGVSYSVSQYAPNSQNILFNQTIFFLDNLTDTIHDAMIQRNAPDGWYITIDQIQYTTGRFVPGQGIGDARSSKAPVSAIVGGVIGGLVVLILVVFLSLRFCCGCRISWNYRPTPTTQIPHVPQVQAYQSMPTQIYQPPQIPTYQDPSIQLYQTSPVQIYSGQSGMFSNTSGSMSYDSSGLPMGMMATTAMHPAPSAVFSVSTSRSALTPDSDPDGPPPYAIQVD